MPSAVHGFATGAEIDESLIDLELFVKQTPEASDENSGTNAAPFRTIQAAANQALELAQEGKAVRVNVYPGVYRESIVLKLESGAFNAPIVIESWDAGEAIVSGADIWNGWRVGKKDFFEMPWPYPAEEKGMSIFPALMTNSELVFVEGARLTQVNRLSDMGVGRFYIDRAAEKIYLLPTPNGTVQRDTVEVGNPTRQTLFYAENVQDLVLRDMAFVRAPTSIRHEGEAVTFRDCNQLLVENCMAEYNNRAGFEFVNCSNVTARFVFADHNGWSGIKVRNCINFLIQGGEAELNGWRLLDAKYENAFNLAAVDIAGVDELVLDGLRLAENRSSGLQLRDVTEHTLISKVFAASNAGYGLSLMDGDITLTHSNIFRNSHGGLLNEANTSLKGNVIFDNGGSQIECSRLQAKSNIIGSHNKGDRALIYRPSGENEALELDSNLYYTVETKPFQYGTHELTLDEWQQVTLQDLKSSFANPLFVDAKGYDYVPLPKSPWYKMKKREAKVISPEEHKAARVELLGL